MSDSPIVYYIYLNAVPNTQSSVQQKISNQIRIAREMGYQVTGMFFTSEPVFKNENKHILWFQIPSITKGYFRSFRQHSQNINFALQQIKKTDDPSKIYFMRFGICNIALLRLSYYLRGRIVFNHLSVETDEYALYQSDAGSSVSRFFSNIEFKWLPIWLDSTLGKLIRRNSKGAIVNSEEIAIRQQKKCLGKYPCEIIPDAVDTEAFPVLPSKKFGENINMVFLKGASMDAEYNGLDRLMKGMAAYVGPRKFTLTILGNHTTMEEKTAKNLGLQDRVFFKKAIYGIELNGELEKYHIGVGPLAVHRKGIKATSSIKTREFMARGLPFFIAHSDDELFANPDCSAFYEMFDADENYINIHWLEDILMRLNNMPDYPMKMRAIARQHFDYKVKLPRWFDFITQ
jgi:hypothetical protein